MVARTGFRYIQPSPVIRLSSEAAKRRIASKEEADRAMEVEAARAKIAAVNAGAVHLSLEEEIEVRSDVFLSIWQETHPRRQGRRTVPRK